jgi:CheY-like chemotaxis protein
MDDSKVSQVGAPNGEVQSQLNRPLRILVVEDDEILRRLNAGVLNKLGYQVDAVEDGSVAWNQLQRDQYDLLLTDNEMPNLSGVELLEKLRAARIALPVIMASGAMPAEIIQDSHPVAKLWKPYTPEELAAAVQGLLPSSGVR